MSAKSCINRLEVYSSSGITGNANGLFIDTPEDVDEFYVKITATEDTAGGATVTLSTNESESATNLETVHQVALTATGVTRVASGSVSGTSLLGPQLYVAISSVTGEWTISVELWYAKESE